MSDASRLAMDRLLPLALAVLAAGCAGSSARVNTVAIADFAHPPEHLRTDVVELSPAVLAAPEVDTIETVRAGSDTKRTIVSEKLADGERVLDEVTPKTTVEKIPLGKVWPIDALVGQINGRPLFADEFFAPLADQLQQIASNPDRVAGRDQFVRTVRAHFKTTVDSELIVAEAESQLTPEQQQGVLAWLKSIQEATIAERGGSLAAAEASLEAEEDKTLDEFMQQRREVSLAVRLLNQRIEPRAIVSWREVQQVYDRDSNIYNPPAQIRIGRIKLDNTADAEKVARVKELAAEGKKFSEIAQAVGLGEPEPWQTADLPADGVEGLQLSDGVISRIKDLKVDAVSEPLVQKDFTSWFTVLSLSKPQSRSIYDRDLQLEITKRLQDLRRAVERQRYIGTLRSRWVTDDIVEMEERLLAFGFDRYWR